MFFLCGRLSFAFVTNNQQLFPKVRPKLGFSFALRMEAYLAVAETFVAFAFQRKIDFWFEMILRESTVDHFVANRRNNLSLFEKFLIIRV